MLKLAAAEHENAEWHVLVGKAILFFGEIELISLKCLSHIPADSVGGTAARLTFSRRVDLLLEILKGRKELSIPLQGLREGFNHAKRLTKTRNLIAHNPLLLDLYANETMDDRYVEWSIRSAREGEAPFRLEDLKEFAADEVIHYSDDILVGGATQQECWDRTERVLAALARHTIPISIEKSSFGVRSVVFVGWRLEDGPVRKTRSW